MFNRKLLLLGIVLITVEIGIAVDFFWIVPGVAADVPFVFSGSSSSVAGYSSEQLEVISHSSPDLAGVPSISTPDNNSVLEVPVVGSGSAPGVSTESKVGDLKKLFDSRVEPDNSKVHEEALVLVAKYPGDYTIDQICSIYEYLKEGWHYVRDPRGVNNFFWANETLKVGEKANCVGVGDCGDFAILMSALAESVGGTTRIILASNNTTGGHAYTEVYLGQLGTKNSQVEDIINWLKQKFNTDKIYTHIDTDTKDVWLNLDWGADEKGNAHPGGPFFQGDKHIVLCIRDKFAKTPLKMDEVVVFPDPKLDAAIRVAINKPQGTIYAADLEKIVTIYANNTGIKDINGLEYCTKLQTLDLAGNNITDFSFLAGLKNLQTLYLEFNGITDVSSLAGLTNLQTLDLDDNNITDFSFLAGLTNLQTLYLEDNQITDVSSLAALTNLQTLYLDCNRITDVSPLAGFTNLQTLKLEFNRITDVSPLAGLTNLQTLELEFNRITDVSPLVGLTNLQTLDLIGNQITDVSSLAGLKKLYIIR